MNKKLKSIMNPLIILTALIAIVLTVSPNLVFSVMGPGGESPPSGPWTWRCLLENLSNLSNPSGIKLTWFGTLIVLGLKILFILYLILIPILLFIFFQGLLMRLRHADDPILRAKGSHKISLGLPIIIIILVPLFLYPTYLYPHLAIDSLSFATLPFLATLIISFSLVTTFIISLAMLLMRGMTAWIKNLGGDPELRKRGRNKVVFAICYAALAIVTLLYFSLIGILMNCSLWYV